MRSLNLSLVGGVLSLALLAAAPSAATAQRFHTLPVHPMVMPATPRATVTATSNFRPHLGIQPSSFVGVSTVFPFNPRTGTFSAVGVSSGFAVPTTTLALRQNEAIREARTLAYVDTLYRASAYTPYTSAYSNPYMGYYNSYSMPYTPYSMMYSSGYGGGYGGGGYGGGGYGGGGGASNPYLSYTNPSSQPVATSAPSAAPALNKIVEVGVYDNRFEPVSITISTGTSVRWTNYSNDKHSVTSDSGLWDSKGLNPGATTSYTFTQPGTYTYHSTLNSKITGTIVVQ